MTTQAQTQGLGQFARWRFTLYHSGNMVILQHDNQQIGIFSQVGDTEESLQAECALHLAKYHGWDGCLWKQIKYRCNMNCPFAYKNEALQIDCACLNTQEAPEWCPIKPE